MASNEILAYLFQWSLIGSALFCVYVVMVFRTGIVYTAREEDGTLKKKVPVSGILNMAGLLLAIVGLQVAANAVGVSGKGFRLAFLALFGLNYTHYLILFVFDTLVIDVLVLGIWRPAFLQIPDSMGRESMKEHITTSIPVGLAAGVLLAGISTTISYLFILPRFQL
jgi:hypothetical protein